MIKVGETLAPIVAAVANSFTFLIQNAKTVLSVFKILAVAVGAYAIATKGLAFAKNLYTGAVKLAAVATRVFNTVLKGNPYVLIASLVISIALAIYEFREQINNAIAKLREFVAPLDMFLNGLEMIGITIGKATEPMKVQENQLERITKKLERLSSADKLKALEQLREKFEGNAVAIGKIDAEISKLRSAMEKDEEARRQQEDEAKEARKKALQEKADAERKYLNERLAIARKIEDLENQLIGDENERAKKQTQVKFARLREDAEAELNDKKITFAEFSRLNDLYFKMEESETKKHNTVMAKKRDELFAQNLAEQLKAEADKAKARADFLKNYTIPTLEDLFDEESAALGDALAKKLISYEEYYDILMQMDEKYAAKKKKIEEDAAAETLQNMQKAVGLASTGIKDIIAGLGGTQGEYAEFTKALAIFDIAMNQGVAIAAAIKGATTAASAKGPAAPFVVAGYIASMVGAVVAGFGQISALTAAEPPKFFEGTDFVPLGGNKRGKDTVPALLNEGEAVIPTDQNAEYPGMAKAWLNNDLSPYIHRNFVAPALKRQREEMQMRQWKEMGSAMVANFDDYRLHRDLNEQTGVLRSGFASLKEGRAKIRGRG
jgi:hypothetical protein